MARICDNDDITDRPSRRRKGSKAKAKDLLPLGSDLTHRTLHPQMPSEAGEGFPFSRPDLSLAFLAKRDLVRVVGLDTLLPRAAVIVSQLWRFAGFQELPFPNTTAQQFYEQKEVLQENR